MAPDGERTAFLDLTASHGVQPLLAHQLHQTPTGSRWPVEIREPLRRAARLEAVAETVRRRELRRVLAALDSVKVRSLLMKGAAVAYLPYPHPALRPGLLTMNFQSSSPQTPIFFQPRASRAAEYVVLWAFLSPLPAPSPQLIEALTSLASG